MNHPDKHHIAKPKGLVQAQSDFTSEGAPATELVCMLRYKRHHFTAAGLVSSKIAQEFLVAERVAIECYSQMIDLIGTQDATTRHLLEDILSEEQAHAEELKAWSVA